MTILTWYYYYISSSNDLSHSNGAAILCRDAVINLRWIWASQAGGGISAPNLQCEPSSEVAPTVFSVPTRVSDSLHPLDSWCFCWHNCSGHREEVFAHCHHCICINAIHYRGINQACLDSIPEALLNPVSEKWHPLFINRWGRSALSFVCHSFKMRISS